MSLESSDSEEKVKVGFCWQLSDGRYLSGRDSDFIERAVEDIQSFNKKGIRDSILIFPPFKNFHRFLIHDLVEENFKDLTTFSIGQARDRRTVVCYKGQVIQNRIKDKGVIVCGEGPTPMGIEQHTSECHEDNITSTYSGRKKARMLPDVALYQPPALRRAREGASGGASLDVNPKQSKQRRPDIEVYVPRALRGSSCPQKAVPAAIMKDPHVEGTSPCQGRAAESEGSPLVHAGPQKDPPTDKRSPPHHCPRPVNPPNLPSPPAPSALSPNRCPTTPTVREEATTVGEEEDPEEGSALTEEGASLPSVPPVCGSHGVKGDGTLTAAAAAKTVRVASKLGISGGIDDSVGGRKSGVGHWEDLLDEWAEEGGEGKLGGELVDEVVAAVGKVSVVEKPKSDYLQFRTDDAAMSFGELTHVVEVFGFPAEFKTHDLISILSPYGGGPGFEIKWVDDTHALAVFGSSFVAADVLNLHHPMLKTRAMEGASAASRAKARRICESLRVPYRPRPETCAALAQRLITGALGVHHRQSKAEREEERRLLREAREKRRSAARERDAAWEGTIGSTLL